MIPSFAVREGARKLEAVRKAVGDDFDICVEAHGQLTTVMAIDFCTRIEELRPLFVEEATQLEDLGELELCGRKPKFRWPPASDRSPNTGSPSTACVIWSTTSSRTSVMQAESSR